MKVEVFNNISSPLCVLGAVDSDRGHLIAEEMKQWIMPNFELHIVWHDGSLFEQPAIRYMQDLCKSTNRSCLYLHTKGAFHDSKRAEQVRKLWRQQFTENVNKYMLPLNTNKPIITTPFSGQKLKHTWYNGFFANYYAMNEIQPVEQSNNRYDFESLFRNSNVEVIGVIINHADLGTQKMREVRRYVDSL